MKKKTLQKIARRHQAATWGSRSWQRFDQETDAEGYGRYTILYGEQRPVLYPGIHTLDTTHTAVILLREEDAAFFEHAHSDVFKLLEEIARLEGVVAHLSAPVPQSTELSVSAFDSEAYQAYRAEVLRLATEDLSRMRGKVVDEDPEIMTSERWAEIQARWTIPGGRAQEEISDETEV